MTRKINTLTSNQKQSSRKKRREKRMDLIVIRKCHLIKEQMQEIPITQIINLTGLH